MNKNSRKAAETRRLRKENKTTSSLKAHFQPIETTQQINEKTIINVEL